MVLTDRRFGNEAAGPVREIRLPVGLVRVGLCDKEAFFLGATGRGFESEGGGVPAGKNQLQDLRCQVHYNPHTGMQVLPSCCTRMGSSPPSGHC